MLPLLGPGRTVVETETTVAILEHRPAKCNLGSPHCGRIRNLLGAHRRIGNQNVDCSRRCAVVFVGNSNFYGVLPFGDNVQKFCAEHKLHFLESGIILVFMCMMNECETFALKRRHERRIHAEDFKHRAYAQIVVKRGAVHFYQLQRRGALNPHLTLRPLPCLAGLRFVNHEIQTGNDRG